MHRFSCCMWALLTLSALCLFNANLLAATDYMFYSVNGDTSATSMTQGDSVAWGANCGIGDSLSWELWYDVDIDGMIDMPGDVQLVTFVGIDGDTSTESDGLPDINPIPDGWYITPPMVLGIAAGQYVFKATNLFDSSSVQKPLVCIEVASPPNTFSGWLTVPGHPAPDSAMLRNRWIQAEGNNAEFQIWTAMTNDSGRFTINIGDVGTGLEFRIGPPDIPGFVTPSQQMLVAAGHIDSVNFVYAAPVDSIWGYLVDENDSVITQPVWVHCSPRYGCCDRDTRTENGKYVIYFGALELGEWTAGVSPDGLVPAYMEPANFDFENTGNGLRHDFICPTANTVVYAEVTENGGPPAHRYSVYARHQYSGVSTSAVSDTGFDNTVTLHITQLYGSDWEVGISIWDDRFPIPEGYSIDGSSWGLHPGETAHLNLTRGHMVCDTIKSDPADPPVAWDSVTVSVYAWIGPSYYGSPDSNGVFTFFVEDGDYTVVPSAAYYFVNPPAVDLGWVDHDTVGGMGIEINRAHCRVHGTLTGVSLPLSGDFWMYAQGDTLYPGYTASAPVDPATGAYEMYLCNSDWAISPPYIPDYIAPDLAYVAIDNAPDTTRVVDFEYTGTVKAGEPGVKPTAFALLQNYPNPFNPATQIRFTLPAAARVRMEVFDMIGRRVATLFDGVAVAGEHALTWDGRNHRNEPVSSGVYFYRLRTADGEQVRKMLLLK